MMRNERDTSTEKHTLIIYNRTEKQCQDSLPDGNTLQHRSDKTGRFKDLGEDSRISDRGDIAPIDRGHDGQPQTQTLQSRKGEGEKDEEERRGEKEEKRREEKRETRPRDGIEGMEKKEERKRGEEGERKGREEREKKEVAVITNTVRPAVAAAEPAGYLLRLLPEACTWTQRCRNGELSNPTGPMGRGDRQGQGSRAENEQKEGQQSSSSDSIVDQPGGLQNYHDGKLVIDGICSGTGTGTRNFRPARSGACEMSRRKGLGM